MQMVPSLYDYAFWRLYIPNKPLAIKLWPIGVGYVPRESHKELDRRIERVNSRCGLSLLVDKDLVGFRIMLGSRNMSPRQSLHLTLVWLEAFEVGIEVGKERTMSDMRKVRME